MRLSCFKLLFFHFVLALLVCCNVNALEVKVTPELSDVVSPNIKLNYTLEIYDYPVPYHGAIKIETDLVSSHFTTKGSGEVIIGQQNILIKNITSPEFYVQISGRTPLGVETKYVNVFDKDLHITKFDEGPYNYYVVMLLDANGNIIDKKIAIFKLKFEELDEYNKLISNIKNEKIKKIAEELKDTHQIDKAIELLKTYDESQNNKNFTIYIIIVGIGGIGVGLIIGFMIGKKTKEGEEGNEVTPPR